MRESICQHSSFEREECPAQECLPRAAGVEKAIAAGRALELWGLAGNEGEALGNARRPCLQETRVTRSGGVWDRTAQITINRYF
jgi:hypothetical protein